MAGSPSSIQELRTRLEQSRWQLHDGLSRLEDRLHDPAALSPSPAAILQKASVSQWAPVALGVGMFVLTSLVPRLPAIGTRPWLRRVLPLAAEAAVVIGLAWMGRRNNKESSA
ncbi:MAG: hypothetical protein ACO1TE_23495 [Prosthecobacter sp.]